MRLCPVAISLLLSPFLAAGCALPPWAHGMPKFPANETSWELPLYEPLTQIGPRVVATFCGATSPGQATPCEQVLLFVDSGSSHSALPEATFEHLRVVPTTSRFATIQDAAGVKRSWSGALVPEARIEDRLTLHDVVVSVHDRTPILGADVLAARGWQIDLDRGTLLLGAAPWPTGPDVVDVPTSAWGAHSIVELGLQGARVPVLLDTGALVTVVERELLLGLGIPEHRFAYPFPLGNGPGSPKLESAFDGEVALGGRGLGKRSISALTIPGVLSTRGMLGFDILSGYTFQVTASGLRLRARTPSLLDTAGARIARWKDLPRCPDLPGCVAAAPVAPGDPAARVHVRIAAAFPRATRFLFGCADGQGRLGTFPVWLEISVHHPAAGAAWDTTPPGNAALRQLWASRCTRLALLDINPVVDDVRPLAADVESRFAMQTRNARLR